MANMADPVRDLIEPTVSAMGFDLVRVAYTGDVETILQIMAESPDGTMSIDDCSKVSRAISAILDVEDPIAGQYSLEVSSPGIDRPLVRETDFEKFAGFEAKVVLHASIAGQRKFRGRIIGFADSHIVLQSDRGEHRLPYTDVVSAKLVLTDELIAAHQAAEAANNDQLQKD